MNITRIITKCFTFGEKAVKHVLKAKPKKIEGLALKTLNHDVVQISKSAAKETSAATSAISQKLTKITATAEAATKSATKASSEVAKTISLKETTHAAKTVIKQEEAISRAAQRVSGDKDVQKALVELTKKEGIIIRTKEDAFPILRKQYQSLSPKEQKNLFILNINPQTNNGMPKSNTLISQWYAEANGIDPSRIITINPEEMLSKNLAPQKICREWKAGNKSASSIMKKVARIKPEENPMSLDKARKLIDEIKGLPEEEILKKASIDEIAQAIEKVNTSLIRPFKQGGYTTALASQIQEITSKANGKVHFVIPDDCSLSGSSIICDSARIIERAFPQGTAGREVKFIFSPMIFGEKAEEVIGKFAVKQGLTDEAFLRRINAIAVDGKENFPGARKVFQNIEKLTDIEFKTTSEARKAVHFTETETFKKLGETNPVLQQKLLYIMQGPISESGHLFGGFGNCGVMVITPTENFVIDGVKYAGKVPTNSVGFMEAVGLESGVLNDLLPKDPKGKGLFIKGTGKGYQRYIEWENLFNPTSINDRIPIIIDGTTIRKAC